MTTPVDLVVFVAMIAVYAWQTYPALRISAACAKGDEALERRVGRGMSSACDLCIASFLLCLATRDAIFFLVVIGTLGTLGWLDLVMGHHFESD